MPRTETSSGLVHGADSRVGIIAGGGALPGTIAQSLKKQASPPYILMVEGETDPDSGLEDYDHEVMVLEDAPSLVGRLRRQNITHVVMAGEIKRRPRLAAMRPGFGMLRYVPALLRALSSGDDGLLRFVVTWLEDNGFKVVGAHQIVPDLLAMQGQYGKIAPQKADWPDIEAGRIAAEAIGALDIGQGAVAIGGRAIALEGIEGTDAMLVRVKDLRDHGRLAGKRRGVLVKCSKPGQELRTDLPSIGPRTIDAAHAAGLAGIAVEAGGSLVLNGPEMIARADALGLFVIGLPPGEVEHGQ
ncbi:LpxI family protein [Aquamicrobium segne]|uniref:LpxI family protein n=1 Tax=Aquamicrobium segne TaxID=469547 RepID=A0ABW0GZV1_9HYPH